MTARLPELIEVQNWNDYRIMSLRCFFARCMKLIIPRSRFYIPAISHPGSKITAPIRFVVIRRRAQFARGSDGLNAVIARVVKCYLLGNIWQ